MPRFSIGKGQPRIFKPLVDLLPCFIPVTVLHGIRQFLFPSCRSN